MAGSEGEGVLMKGRVPQGDTHSASGAPAPSRQVEPRLYLVAAVAAVAATPRGLHPAAQPHNEDGES